MAATRSPLVTGCLHSSCLTYQQTVDPEASGWFVCFILLLNSIACQCGNTEGVTIWMHCIEAWHVRLILFCRIQFQSCCTLICTTDCAAHRSAQHTHVTKPDREDSVTASQVLWQDQACCMSWLQHIMQYCTGTQKQWCTCSADKHMKGFENQEVRPHSLARGPEHSASRVNHSLETVRVWVHLNPC